MDTPAERLRAALTELAGEDLDALIAEARQIARARVRDQITDALADVMLEQAGRRLAPETRPRRQPKPPPAVAPAREPKRAPTGTALYTYCVVAAGTELPEGLPSIDPAASPTLVEHGELAAVVSEVPLAEFEEERLRENLADMEWLERAARAHEGVLETLGAHTTLIPMRLCSLYHDRAGVVAMLSREATALGAALEHLEGKREWGVKAFARPPRSESATAPGDSGTDYMRRRRDDRQRRQEADQQQYETCLAIHERLTEVVADALTSPPQRPEASGHPGQMLLNGVYLVEDEQQARFSALVEELQAEHLAAGIDLELTGPWPAYNFVPGTIGAAW